MAFDDARWIMLPAAASGLLAIAAKGATPGRLAFTAVCGLAWYALSRRKSCSLDRERFRGGKLGRNLEKED